MTFSLISFYSEETEAQEGVSDLVILYIYHVSSKSVSGFEKQNVLYEEQQGGL